MHRPGGLIYCLLMAAVLLTSAGGAYGQYMKHFNAYQFLGASNVYHVSRDRAGFLWFATDHGLIRYDGSSMQYFNRQNGLPDNTVFNIFEDSRGRIWPFCYNGRYCFIEGDSVHHAGNDKLLALLPVQGSYATCMTEDTDGTYYMGFLSRGLLQFRGSRVTYHPNVMNKGGFMVTSRRIVYSADLTEQSNFFIAGGARLVSDRSGIRMFRQDSLVWKVDDPRLTNLTVTDLFLTRNEELLIGTTYGLVIMDVRTRKKTHLLNGMRVSSCTADITGNLWITTIDNGIYLLHQDIDRIHLLEGLDEQGWSMINNRQPVFIKNNQLYELKPEGTGIAVVPANTRMLSTCNPLLVNKDLIAFYDTWRKGTFIRLKGRSEIRQGVFFKGMYDSGDSCFFAYGSCGAGVLGGWTDYYRLTAKGLQGLGNEQMFPQKIAASCQDHQTGKVFFITGSTLYRCDFGAEKNELILSSPELAGVTNMFVHNGCLIMARSEHRFLSLSPIRAGGRLRVHPTGFIVQGFVSGTQGRLIGLSDRANYLLAPDGKTAPQQIQYPFSSSVYEHIAQLGNNYLVQIDGRFYYFDTSLLNRQAPPSRVYLKQLVINGRSYTSRQIDIRNTTKLDIQVSAGVLNFGHHTPGIRYRIISSGMAGDWRTIAATEMALVLRKAGDYRIEIAGADGGTEKPVIIGIRVHTPFLQSAGFYVLCSLLAVLLCAGIFLLILRYRKLHFTRELEYLKMENKAINALLNPHFVFNSINNIQGLIHKAKSEDAADYLAVLSHLIRQNLENLQYNLIPLEDELGLIRRYIRLQNLRFSNNIILSIETGDMELQLIQVPPLLIHTFVENAIVHGYHFKDQPFLITLSFVLQDDDYLRIDVTDNGIGLHAAGKAPPTHHGASIGIAFNENRLRRLSDFYNLEQSIHVRDLSDEGGQGTAVRILLYARLETFFELHHLPVH